MKAVLGEDGKVAVIQVCWTVHDAAMKAVLGEDGKIPKWVRGSLVSRPQ